MKAEIPFVKQEGFPSSQMQENLVQKINLLTKIPFLSGTLIKDVALTTGSNKVAHKLGRVYQGWFITKRSSAATVFQTAASDDDLYLTLTVSANITVDLWVF